MKPFLSFFIVFFLGMQTSFAAFPLTNPDQNTPDYCNTRYDFCVSYPEDVFSQLDFSDNGDGFVAASKDEHFTLTVSGSYNIMDWTLDDLYFYTAADMQALDERMQVVQTNFDDYVYEATFQVGDELHYFKFYLLDDSMVTMSITSPVLETARLEQLKSAVDLLINI